MVTILLLLPLLLLPSQGHAFTFTDVPAQVQRQLSNAEQKIQTLRLVQLVREMQNNYQAAKMTYEMAKAGYENATDPEQWKALAEYEKMRLKDLVEGQEDPKQATLFRAVEALDQAVDSYILSSELYMGAENLASKTGDRISDFDRQVAPTLELATGMTALTSIANNANAKKLELDMARQQVLLSRTLADELRADTQNFKEKAVKLADQYSSLEKIKIFAAKDKQWAQDEMKRADTDKKRKSAQVAIDRATAYEESAQKSQERLAVLMGDYSKEAIELADRAKGRKQDLETASASLGLEGIASRIILSAGLSSMGEKDLFVKNVASGAQIILLTALALALLMHGYGMVMRNESHAVPHDVVVGLVLAFVFMSPSKNPLIVQAARQIALVTDSVEKTIFEDELNTAAHQLFAPYREVVEMVTGFGKSEKKQGVVLESKNEEKEQTSVVGAILKFGGMSFMGNLLINAGAQASAYLGVIAVIISMNLRTLSYWVLMVISPLIIALAPLKWARKTVLPGWGTAIYAVLLWGFIAKTLLLMNNTLAVDNMSMVDHITREGPSMKLFYGGMQGVLLAMFMVFSPLISYSLARGSFDGMATAVGSAGGAASGWAISKLAAGGISGTNLGGGLLTKLGNQLAGKAGGKSGAAWKTVGGLGRGLSTAGTMLSGISQSLSNSPRVAKSPATKSLKGSDKQHG